MKRNGTRVPSQKVPGCHNLASYVESYDYGLLALWQALAEGFSGLLRVCDVRAVVTRDAEALDWDGLARRGREGRLGPTLDALLRLADRLLGLLSAADREHTTLIQEPIQRVKIAEIERLDQNDLLFVDSSHVSKIGSDVNHIVFEILPALRPGVIVHFHDIHWPFEYPEDWVMLGRAWNEAYLVRAFLQFNDSFEILFFNSLMQRRQPEVFERMLPSANETRGSSLWLRRRGSA